MNKPNPKKFIACICRPVEGDLCRWEPLGYFPSLNQGNKAIKAAIEAGNVIAYVVLKDGKSNAATQLLYERMSGILDGEQTEA